MGNVIKAIGDSVDNVVSAIEKDCGDVVSTAKQIAGLATALAVPATINASKVRLTSKGGIELVDKNGNITKYIDFASGYLEAGADPISDAVKNALNAAKTGTIKNFGTVNPNVNISGTGGGIVQGYVVGSDLTSVINNMTDDFKAWQVFLSASQVAELAKNIADKVAATGGLATYMHGQYKIDSNDTVDWELACGTFLNSATETDLVYAYSVGAEGGFRFHSNAIAVSPKKNGFELSHRRAY